MSLVPVDDGAIIVVDVKVDKPNQNNEMNHLDKKKRAYTCWGRFFRTCCFYYFTFRCYRQIF